MSQEIMLSILSILLTVYIISFIVLLILENRDPDKTIAWILVVLLLPIIGLLVYFYLGQNWKKKQFIKHFHTKTLHSLSRKRMYYSKQIISKIAKEDVQSPLEQKMIDNIKRSSNFGLTTRNNIKFFFNGSKKFSALIKYIRSAKKYVHIEYYLVRNDKYGEILKDVLIEKAQEGVEVRALFDFYGSFFFLRKYQKVMQKAGVNVHSFFNPFRLFNHYKLNYRNHRKIVIIDGKKGFLGGMNIGEEYIDGGGKFQSWKDFHILVEGECVHQLQTIFIYDWYLTRKESIINKKYYPVNVKSGLKHKVIQAVHSGPDSERNAIKQAYFLMITNADRYIWIASPYFIPDESMMTALKSAALSGVDVRIMLPSKSDKHHIPFNASRTYFEELMGVGVKIYEYLPGFMHGKMVVADGTIASIGTTNFDIRAFQVNFESNIVLYSKDDVKTLVKEFKSMFSECKKVVLDEFKKRSIAAKFRQSLARLFSPLL